MTAILRQQQTVIEQYTDLISARQHPKLALFKGSLVIYSRDQHSLIGTVIDLVQRIMYQIRSWWDNSLSFSRRAINQKVDQINDQYTNHCKQVALEKFGLLIPENPKQEDFNKAFDFVKNRYNKDIQEYQKQIAYLETDISGYDERVEDGLKALREFEAKKTALETQKSELEREIDTLNHEKEALQAHYLQEKADYAAWQSSVQQLAAAAKADSHSDTEEPLCSAGPAGSLVIDLPPKGDNLQIQYAPTTDLLNPTNALKTADSASASAEPLDALSFLNGTGHSTSSESEKIESTPAVVEAVSTTASHSEEKSTSS